MKLKPIEVFLMNVHPEVVQRGTTLLVGTDVEFGKVDGSDIRRLVREHRAAGQDALKGFTKWLVRSEGIKQAKACNVTATVWNALCMTFDPETRAANPTALLDKNDETYTYATKAVIAHALKFWARYNNDAALYERIMIWSQRPNCTPQYVLDTLRNTPPYTRTEYRRLLKALEEYRGSPRYPWAWPCLRLAFTCGTPFSEIVYLERTAVRQALQEGEILLRIGRVHGRQVLPISRVREELEYLMSFPFEWNVVGDLTDPVKRTTLRQGYSTQPLTRVVKLVFTRSKVPYTPNWAARMRWSAAWQYYQATDNLVGAAQVLRYKGTQKVARFFEELKKQAAATEKDKVEEDPSSTL